MQFRIGDERFFIRKLPKKNIVEVKISGQVLLYDRADGNPQRLSEDDHPNEEIFKELIQQFFVGTKQNRHRNTYKGYNE